jgi:hypothetical protein
MVTAADDEITILPGACYAENGDYIRWDTPLSSGSMLLSTDKKYHIYVYLNNGTPTLDVSRTAPAIPYFGTARSKPGDASYRYIGMMHTDTDGDLYVYYHYPEENLVIRSIVNNTNPKHRVLSGGTVDQTDPELDKIVPCGDEVPPGCTAVWARMINTSSDAFVMFSSAAVDVLYNNTPLHAIDKKTAGANYNPDRVSLLPIDDNYQFKYAYRGPITSGAAYVDIMGWKMPR